MARKELLQFKSTMINKKYIFLMVLVEQVMLVYYLSKGWLQLMSSHLQVKVSLTKAMNPKYLPINVFGSPFG